jgi:hypothetical protein
MSPPQRLLPSRTEAQFQALRYFTLNGTDHTGHAEQASMVRRYVAWRNRNARDRRSCGIVDRAKGCLTRHELPTVRGS